MCVRVCVLHVPSVASVVQLKGNHCYIEVYPLGIETVYGLKLINAFNSNTFKINLEQA